nr:PVC-type heme-binding CxxCH protein [Verrucomicrobium spinosum]
MDWDEKGRMWVVEMGDYPFAPGEKTTDGRGDGGTVSPMQSGRIKILEDTDGDHVYDQATLFLDGLRHPTGLAFWKGGVFISAIPDIVYARDTDGDGRCDQRESWFKGFTAGNPQHLVNGFAWGLDGWLYGANGDSGGEVTSVKSGRKVNLGTYDFRFHPDTGEFRLETGRSQYGKWRDDYGNWYGNNNSTLGWHYHIPMSYMEAHPEKVPASIRTTLNPDVKVFTISPPVKRFNHAGATHVLTAACSPMPWHDAHMTPCSSVSRPTISSGGTCWTTRRFRSPAAATRMMRSQSFSPAGTTGFAPRRCGKGRMARSMWWTCIAWSWNIRSGSRLVSRGASICGRARNSGASIASAVPP